MRVIWAMPCASFLSKVPGQRGEVPTLCLCLQPGELHADTGDTLPFNLPRSRYQEGCSLKFWASSGGFGHWRAQRDRGNVRPGEATHGERYVRGAQERVKMHRNPPNIRMGRSCFGRESGAQKKILTWSCHLRLKCFHSRTHMGNVGKFLSE